MEVWTKKMFPIFIGLIAICFCLTSAIYADVDFDDCVGMWLFDEGSGKVAKDQTDNKNDGTLQGGAKWTKGKFGSAVKLDGKASDYVEIPDSKSLHMEKNITIMFWVSTKKKMAQANRWAERQVVVGKHYKEYEIGIYDTGHLHTYTSNLAGGYDEGIFASMADKVDPDWKKDKWYHIAWTLDGKNEVAYVNGLQIGDHVKANEGTEPGANPLEIGRRVGGGLPLMGSIDEVVIFNVTMEQDDVKSIMKRGLKGALAVQPEDKLAATWAVIKGR